MRCVSCGGETNGSWAVGETVFCSGSCQRDYLRTHPEALRAAGDRTPAVEAARPQMAEAAARSVDRSGAVGDMVLGGIICLVGIIVTAATYSAASQGGGSYVIAWGAIIFGAIRFLKGVGRLSS